MEKIWYRRRFKIANNLFQGLLAGVVCFCLAQIWALLGGGMNLAQLGRPFEETRLFCETVEGIVRDKIRYAQNLELFEQDGDYYPEKQIDIRQYVSGTLDIANQNRNTTYYLGDLIRFSQDGLQDMENLLSLYEERAGEGESRWEEGAPDLERILPLSGSSLADYARLSSNPGGTLRELYRALCEASREIGDRYQAYLKAKKAGQDLVLMPGNVYYYVENTGTKQRYTNLGVRSVPAARTAVWTLEKADTEILFDGERRFNIMVSNPDYVDNEVAADYFMQARFVGSGEKVMIAADMGYAAGDRLRAQAMLYQQRRPLLILLFVLLAFSFITLLVLLLLSLLATGRGEPVMGGRPGWAKGLSDSAFDAIPTEIGTGLCVIFAILWWMFSRYATGRIATGFDSVLQAAALAGTVTVEYWICLFGILSLVRRYKKDTLFQNSVTYTVVRSGRAVYSARRSGERLFILYAGYVVLNMAFLLIGGIPGGVMALVLNFAALMFLMRDVVGNQSVLEGLRRLQEGNLEYRINTSLLTGASREMGEAVNEMGDGLQKAVDSMLRNERLKSELITNVSHDLKTPLTSIVNYVDLLGRENLENERARSYVKILDAKTRRLRQLTEDLIEVSRIHSGNIALDMAPLPLKDFLRQACGEFEDRLAQKNLRLCMDFPGDSRNGPVICADGTQLFRVFENLLGNACKYAKTGTQIVLCLKEEGEAVSVTLSNECAQPYTGDVTDLMERFVRGDTSRKTEGSGLGLSIAKSLTELMQGTFDIRMEEQRFVAVLRFMKFI